MTRTSDWSKGAGRTGFSDQLHDLWQTRPVRFPKDGPIAGVAVGFGRRYGVDPVLVRVAFVVSALFGGAGIVLYLLCWLLLNQTGDQSSAAESLFGRGRSSHSSSKTIVLMVALGIAVSTMGPVGVGLGGSGVISFALMLAGWWLLYQRQPQPPATYFEHATADSILNTGYPGTTNPFWTGYPGTNAVTFQTYGPYTTLPDHYEPDPNQPAPDSAAAQGMSQPGQAMSQGETGQSMSQGEQIMSQNEQSMSQSDSGEAVTEVLETRYAPASSVSDTVVLRKPESDSGTTASEESNHSPAESHSPFTEASTAPEDQPGASSAGPVQLDKPDKATVQLDKTGGEEPPSEDTPTAVIPVDQPAPPAEQSVESRPLHRIPPTGDRPRTGFGPAPISPDFGPTPPGWDPLGVAPLAWELPEPGGPVPQQAVVQAPPRRPRSRLTVVTIGLAILAAAAAGSVAASGVDWMTPGRIGAAALAVIALGLIIGAFLRRGHGLMVLLAPLAGFVILASLVGPIQFDKGAMGDHTWTAATDSELLPVYHVSMGSGTLDLSKLQLTANKDVDLRVRMGDARVILPPNLRVNTTCNVRMGDSNCLTGMSGPATGPVLNLTVDVQMGNAEVNRGR
ncbi:PspC domain-containing protein [Nocardia sp. CDC153]|uniref:PspC domain-containing protein n=1 Tax=Nocardia sp. CDC153 TaxID=3112167 RepID=UPI002DBC88DC|nr:PspC domain-containing protein [Nocardia sp. CDC153]MEC3954913.1 PspC domain-containing protein [Nocardia sp. CDC153]